MPDFDLQVSVLHAIELIQKAAENGAKLISLPEMFYSPYVLNSFSRIQHKEEYYLSLLKDAACKNKVFLCSGSMAVQRDNQLYNMSHLIGPDGTIIGEYCKCHLFDANIGGKSYRESSVFSAGDNICVVKTELGTIGIMICYDIRFPEFARLYSLSGVEILLVPSVFNQKTGDAHWHTLMKTRAIENQFFVMGISQARNSDSPYQAYGHSLAADPWGDILCEAKEGEEIIYCDLDPDALLISKEKLPLIAHRRKDIYNLSNLKKTGVD